MTPRMFDALLKRRERAKTETEFLFGQLASVFVNYSMSAPKKALPPSDFMPSEIAKRRSKKSKIPTPDERKAIDAQARAFVNALMKDRSGEVTVK